MTSMVPQYTLVDYQASLVRAWKHVFQDVEPDGPTCVQGNILEQPPGTALVSAANSLGWMTGGIDLAYARDFARHHLDIHQYTWPAIARTFHGEIPIGSALVVPTPEHPRWPFLILAPTMRTPAVVSWSIVAYWAFRAVLLAVDAWNADPATTPITHVACPGLGTGTGLISSRHAARQMRAAWDQVHQPANGQPLPLGAAGLQEIRWSGAVWRTAGMWFVK